MSYPVWVRQWLFGIIKTGQDNKTTCGSESYPTTKGETVGLLNNYHVGNHHMRAIPVNEEVAFAQTSRNTKKSKTNKKV